MTVCALGFAVNEHPEAGLQGHLWEAKGAKVEWCYSARMTHVAMWLLMGSPIRWESPTITKVAILLCQHTEHRLKIILRPANGLEALG